MKIAFLTDAWLPVWGGGQEHVLQVSKILKEKYGYTVDIIAPTLIKKDFNFHNFFHRIWFALYTLYFLLSTDFDLYHSHNFSTSAFLPLAKLRGKKIAFTVHGLGTTLIGPGLLNKLGISRFLSWLVLYVWPYDYKFSASPLKGFITVGNGVNVGEYDAVKVKKNPKTFRIVWVGRKYDPVKGVKYLEQAVKQLNNPKIVLDIVENVYGIEKIKRFKQANVFVLPSLSEGLPLVLLEAMASKLPILTTNVGECKKLVESGKCGLVVEPGSAAELATAIKKLMKQDLSKLGNNGYDFVKKNYSWEKVIGRYSGYRDPVFPKA